MLIVENFVTLRRCVLGITFLLDLPRREVT
jgi:hypothetical protein